MCINHFIFDYVLYTFHLTINSRGNQYTYFNEFVLQK
jgi:hypothetical protein